MGTALAHLADAKQVGIYTHHRIYRDVSQDAYRKIMFFRGLDRRLNFDYHLI
jgi:hypothetical protein